MGSWPAAMLLAMLVVGTALAADAPGRSAAGCSPPVEAYPVSIAPVCGPSPLDRSGALRVNVSDVARIRIEGDVNVNLPTVDTRVTNTPSVQVVAIPPIDIDQLPAIDVRSMPGVPLYFPSSVNATIERMPDLRGTLAVHSLPPVDVASLPVVLANVTIASIPPVTISSMPQPSYPSHLNVTILNLPDRLNVTVANWREPAREPVYFSGQWTVTASFPCTQNVPTYTVPSSKTLHITDIIPGLNQNGNRFTEMKWPGGRQVFGGTLPPPPPISLGSPILVAGGGAVTFQLLGNPCIGSNEWGEAAFTGYLTSASSS